MAGDPRGHRLEPWCCAGGALLLYALLGQRVLYKSDGTTLLWMLREGRLHDYGWQLGYLPLLDAFRSLLAAMGLRPAPLRLAELFSALGMALCVLGFRAGLRTLAIERREARAATLLLALNPGCLLFASVVELHAPAMAAVGLSFWWFTGCVQRPAWWRLFGLGLCTHVAFLMHSTNVFLPALLLPWYLALRWRAGTRRRDFGCCALAGGAHAVAFLLLPQLLPRFYGDYTDLGAALAREASIGRPQSLDWMPAIFWQEWLLPLLPLSVLVWLAVLRRQLRGELLAFALGLLPYLWLSTRQLVFEPEFGAYMLPLLLPAARLSAAWLSGRWLWPLLAASLLGGVAHVQAHEAAHWPAYERFAAELERAAAGRRAWVLFGTYDELAMAEAMLPADDLVWVRGEAAMAAADYSEAHGDDVVAGLRLLLRDRAVLLTDGALQMLRDPPAVLRAEGDKQVAALAAYAGPRLLARIEQAFELLPAAARADPGGGQRTTVWRLRPR